MYEVSRSLYRALAPEVKGGPYGSAPNLERVLKACETTMRRLESEPDFADPARFLFEQIRTCFPIGRQAQIRRLIDLYVELGRRTLALIPPERRNCAALTRRGTPCRREAVTGSDFCPTHRNLDLIENHAALEA